MNIDHGPHGPYTDRNNPPDPALPSVRYKHQEVLEFGDTQVLLWHLVMSFTSPKPKQPSDDDARRTITAIERALDLANTKEKQDDAFLLFNPSTNSYHQQRIDPDEYFDLSQYSSSTIPSRPVSRFEITFAIMSPYRRYWNEPLPFASIQSACLSTNGNCFPDKFHGQANALLGIITEVHIDFLPRDKIEKILEAAFEDRFEKPTRFILRKSTMKFKIGAKGSSAEVIQVFGLQEDKHQAVGMLSGIIDANNLRQIGFKRAAFTPMNELAGPTNAKFRAQCLSAHQKFTDNHKVVLLRNVTITDWFAEASSDMCKEVLLEKTYLDDKLKSNSLYDLLFNYLVESRTELVALGSFVNQSGNTTVFLSVPAKRVHNAFEALQCLQHANFRSLFFSAPIDASLPSDCLAYLSKGTDRSSRQEIANRENQRRINLEREFPTLPPSKNGKSMSKTSKQPSSSAAKSYATATAPKPAASTAYHILRGDSKVNELNLENEALKERIRELERVNAELQEQLEDRDRNVACLNNTTSSLHSMFSSLVEHLQLPRNHTIMKDLRRSEIHFDECKQFQQEFTNVAYLDSETSVHKSSSPSSHSTCNSTAMQSSLSARRSNALNPTTQFSGQKRDLSPSSKFLTIQQRPPQSEAGTSTMDIDASAVTLHSGALSASEASEMP